MSDVLGYRYTVKTKCGLEVKSFQMFGLVEGASFIAEIPNEKYVEFKPCVVKEIISCEVVKSEG